MKKSNIYFYVIISLLYLGMSSCIGNNRSQTPPSSPGDTLALNYAENLIIVQYKDYTKVTLLNPWKRGETLHTYILTDRSKLQPQELPEGTIIPVPLLRTLVYSGVHCALLNELKASEAIKGVCDLPYISLPSLQQQYKEGKLIDAGNSSNPDIEKIIDLSPDAILLSPYDNSNGYGRIEKLNIPIIECADYMETSALGRAEWIKFFGILFGKSEQADSIFNQTEKEYLSLKQLVGKKASRPSVISELKIGNTWYVAGGKSTPGKLFEDAGANYVFAHTNQTATIPMAFETVFDQGATADYWLIKYNQKQDKTYSELKQDYAPYANFQAFKQRKIYGCNTRYIPFYEESPFHPEKVLKDFVKIFHPEILPDYQLKYFTPLTE